MAKTQRRQWDVTRKQISYSGSKPFPPVTGSQRYIVATDSVTYGGPVPFWRWKIANGRDATSTLVGEKYILNDRKGFATLVVRDTRFDNLWTLCEQSGCLTDIDFSSVSFIDNTKSRNLAITRFINKARAVQTSLMGGVFLGELGETLRMIRNPAKALRDGLGDYLTAAGRLRRRSRRASLIKDVGDLWLEHSFGWKPLLADIDAGAKALAENANRGFQRNWEPIFVMTSDKGNFSHVTNVRGTGGLSYLLTIRQWAEAINILRGAVYTQCDRPVYMNASNLGFNLDNFIPTVWELIPYSFLVDYFSNIGDVLSAWSYRTSNFAWCAETNIGIKRMEQFNHSLQPYNKQPYEQIYDHYLAPGSSSSELRQMGRGSVNPSSLMPTLTFFHRELGNTKWTNLAALSVQHKSLLPFRK